jgi:CRP-like cAMP-binding protein
MPAIMSEGLSQFLRDMVGARRRLDHGAPLFHAGDRVLAVWLVLEGAVLLRRADANGMALALHRAGPGDLVAEASAFSDVYHCDAVAEGTTDLWVTPRSAFRARLRADGAFAEAVTAHLARSLRSARDRSALLALRGVAERLDAWLACHGGALPPKGAWTALAQEIGVTRPALYRELAARRGRAGL